MRQTYDVHIDGKQFTIGGSPDLRALPRNWLVLRVERPEEMDLAKKTLGQEDRLRGIHVFGKEVEELWQWFRRGFQPVQAAGGAVTDDRGRLLAIHRLGRWDLPKGKVEPGEDVRTAAMREVREECGLRTLDIQRALCETWHTYPRNGVQHLKCTHWFLMHGDSSEPLTAQTEEDIDQARWLDARGVKAMRGDTYPSLIPVLNAWEAAVHGRD